MTDFDGFIEILEGIYLEGDDHKCPDAVRVALWNELSGCPREYLIALTDEIQRIHERRFHTFPGVAVIAKAKARLNRPETYVRPEQRLIEAKPSEEDRKTIIEVMQTAKERKRYATGTPDEPNHTQRQAVRDKVKRGQATDWEIHWIWCIDENGGEWTTMAKGERTRKLR